MHFIYTKTIKIASECNYSIKKICEWFLNYYVDFDALFFENEGILTAKIIVEDILINSRVWFDAFIIEFTEDTEDVDFREHITNTEIVSQLKQEYYDILIQYFTVPVQEYLKNLPTTSKN